MNFRSPEDFEEVDAEYVTAIIDEVDSNLNLPSTDFRSESETVLENIFRDMSEKYQLSFSFRDFQSFLGDLSSIRIGQKQDKMMEGKIISAITSRTILRAVVTNGILVNKALDLMESNIKTQRHIDEVLPIMIEKIFGWIETMGSLEEKYGRPGIDDGLERLAKNASPEKEKTKVPQKTINNIISQLM